MQNHGVVAQKLRRSLHICITIWVSTGEPLCSPAGAGEQSWASRAKKFPFMEGDQALDFGALSARNIYRKGKGVVVSEVTCTR